MHILCDIQNDILEVRTISWTSRTTFWRSSTILDNQNKMVEVQGDILDTQNANLEVQNDILENQNNIVEIKNDILDIQDDITEVQDDLLDSQNDTLGVLPQVGEVGFLGSHTLKSNVVNPQNCCRKTDPAW